MALALRADLATTPPLRAFRDELRAWLGTHLTEDFRVTGLRDPTGADGAEFELRRAWQRELQSGGWAGVHWPAEHGGRSASLAEYAVYLLECAEAGAPEPANVIGINMVGPTLIEHGTPEQQKHLEGILSADHIWSQLFSEPDAGSDLGNISTRAERTHAKGESALQLEPGPERPRQRERGAWRVRGQKVWISWGPVADYGLLLARTGEPGTGFGGLSCFVVGLHEPGVTIRGLRQMSGETYFSEVFLDDVELPDDALVGPEGEGWSVATSTLVHERTTAILSRHATTAAAAAELLDLALRPGVGAAQRDRSAAAWSEAQLFRLTGYRGIASAVAGDTFSPAAATQRLQWGLVNRRIFELGVELQGALGMLEVPPWSRLFNGSRGWTIGGGTSEIQRNMLAERVLGLPREPKR